MEHSDPQPALGGEAINSVLPDPSEEEIRDILNKKNKVPSPLRQRARCRYSDDSGRFQLGTNLTYMEQYSSMYLIRLCLMKQRLLEAARKLWGSNAETKPKSSRRLEFLDGIKDIAGHGECVVVGTLYKEMALKPSVFKEAKDELELEVPPQSFLSESDSLLIEDQSARVNIFPLPGVFDVDRIVSGMTIAVRGHVDGRGRFVASDFCLPGAFQPTALAATAKLEGEGKEAAAKEDKEEEGEEGEEGAEEGGGKYLAFVAGLHVGSAKTNCAHLQFILDFFLGTSIDPVLRRLSAQVVRLVVVGDLLAAVNEEEAPISTVDAFITQIANVVPVDVMSGAHDPTGLSLPQQALHVALLPRAAATKELRTRTNPYAFTVEGVRGEGKGKKRMKKGKNTVEGREKSKKMNEEEGEDG
eukprot:GHVT01059268.1.p1 GENE.GHVT01059268.1~~GHVT01059268.1.p1  ORF type:complete len:414 (+),score=99.50 GHVT01059268.1:190-1431(+)